MEARPCHASQPSFPSSTSQANPATAEFDKVGGPAFDELLGIYSL